MTGKEMRELAQGMSITRLLDELEKLCGILGEERDWTSERYQKAASARQVVRQEIENRVCGL